MIDIPTWVWKFKGELPEADLEDQSLGFDLKGEAAELMWTAAPSTCNSQITSDCWDIADKDSDSLWFYME